MQGAKGLKRTRLTSIQFHRRLHVHMNYDGQNRQTRSCKDGRLEECTTHTHKHTYTHIQRCERIANGGALIDCSFAAPFFSQARQRRTHALPVADVIKYGAGRLVRRQKCSVMGRISKLEIRDNSRSFSSSLPPPPPPLTSA